MPNGPTFFLRPINNNPVQNIADILVAKAKPAIPIYFDKTKFKTIFIKTAIVALIIGVFVSCNE